MINGLLAGLVAVTASANWVTPVGSVIIGGGGGIVALYATRILEKWELDDPVGAIPVHLAGGIFGTLVLPIFAVVILEGEPVKDEENAVRRDKAQYQFC